jgi:hypothetical protein
MSELQFRTESKIPADSALLDCFDLFRKRARSIKAKLEAEGISTVGDLVRSRSRLSDVLDRANLELVADFLADQGYPIPTT